MKEAARIKGIGVSERKSGVDRLIKFIDKKSIALAENDRDDLELF